MSDKTLSGKDGVAVIIAIGAFLICVTMGVRQGFGLFLPPYTEAFGIGRDTFSLAIALQNLLWGIASPMFGALSDRRGPVPAVLVGGLLYTAGMLVMAAAGGGGALILAQTLVGMGLAGAGFSVVLGTVGKVVSARRRSLALGVVSAAGSLGQFLLVPVAQWGIKSLGAPHAAMLMAGFAFLMVLLAPFFKLPADAPRARAAEKSGDVVRAAFACRSYVLLFLGFFVCGFQVVFVATHLPAYAKDLGVADFAAAQALSLIGLFNIFGTMFCGWIGDKMPKKDALAIFYTLRSLVIILFLLAPVSPASIIVFGAALGFLWLGTVPLTSGLVAVMCGPKHMAMLYGFVFLFHQVGSACGAWLGGALFEATGSYDMAWYISIALGFVAAALHYPIKEKLDPRFARQFA